MNRTNLLAMTILAAALALGWSAASWADDTQPAAASQQDTSSTSQSTPPSQQGAPTPAAPMPLPMPSMSGPLQTAVPHEFDGGPFGKLEVTGIVSGMGLTQGNHIFGDNSTHWDISNAQVFIQKSTGWWQFYLQAGAYTLPALGTPFLSAGDTIKNFYTAFPQ